MRFQNKYSYLMALAIAQTVSTAAVAEGGLFELEEVVVTATKRAESVQDVPASISAFSGEGIRQAGIEDSMGVASQVPNLQFRSTFGFSSPQFYLRGLGNRSFHTNAVGPVGIYTDGVTMGNVITQAFPLLDLERLEVVRGPQGTMFGRNTTGGLINFISKKPDPNEGTNGYADLSLGSDNERQIDGAVGFALTDSLATRISVKQRTRDGVFDAQQPGVDDLGDIDMLQYRVQLGYYDPNDKFDVLVRVRGGEIDNLQRPWKQIGTVGTDCPTKLNSQCTDFFGFSDSTDPHETFAQFEGYEKSEADGVDITLNVQLADDLTLTYIAAYDEAESQKFYDEDFSPVALLTDTYDSEVNFSSHELRLTSDYDSDFNWIAGLYYYEDDLDSLEAFSIPDLPAVAVDPGFAGLPSVGFGQVLSQQTESWAAFVSGTWDISDKMVLRAGLRWTYDERDATVRSTVYDSTGLQATPVSEAMVGQLGMFDLIPEMNVKDDWSEPSGTLSLNYNLTDEVTTYVTFARGFKGGEFNGGALFGVGEATLTDPEFVNSWELGLKGNFFDNRVALNIAYFHTSAKDLQVFSLDPNAAVPTQTLTNAGEATLEGIEIDGHWYISDNLMFKGGIGLLDATYDKFQANATTSYAGNTLPYAPDVTFNGLIRYEREVSFGTLAAQVDYRYVTESYNDADNDPSLETDPYHIANAHMSWRDSNEDWEVKLWIRNLDDNEYFSTLYNGGGFGYHGLNFGDPRSYGVSVRYNFGE